jgi:NTP pyrophosphatase (non-canonical NTP hydrolase)
MHAHEYHEAAMRTGREAPPDYFPGDVARNRLLHAALGVGSEVGELLDQYKRHIFYGAPLDRVNVIEECGDLLWFSGLGCDARGKTLARLLEVWGDFDFSHLPTPLEIIHAMQSPADDILGIVLEDSDAQSTLGAFGEIVCLVRELLATVGATLEDAMRANIAKLAKRYPDRFTAERALNRDLEAERAALESESKP